VGGQGDDAIKPGEDEIVIPKTSFERLISTNIDYWLRNLGVRYLMISGVVTDQCVESAVRDGPATVGYLVTTSRPTLRDLTARCARHTLSAIKGYCRQRTTTSWSRRTLGLG